MKKMITATIFLLLACVTGVGQTSYKGLTPGKSTRVEVHRVLGLPVKKVSETLIEYRPQPLTGKIFVQYRQGSPVVERIEMLCRQETSTCNDLIKSLNLRLPEQPDSEKVDEKKWKFLYGSPLFVVTSGDMADVTGDNLPPARLAFYSRGLYEADFVRVNEANEAATVKAEEDRKKPPPLSGAYGEITGIVKLRAADGSMQSVPGATVDFYRTDGIPGHMQTKADKNGVFVSVGLSQTAKWVVVVSGPGLKWTYSNGVQTPVEGLQIVAEPGDGARPTLEQVMSAMR